MEKCVIWPAFSVLMLEVGAAEAVLVVLAQVAMMHTIALRGKAASWEFVVCAF